jgi:hypothetical protein
VVVAGWDSNPRPSGYEPDELPLLHPAAIEMQGTNYRGRLRAAALIHSNGKLLLIEPRHTERGDTFWTLLGGWVPSTESLKECLKREVNEGSESRDRAGSPGECYAACGVCDEGPPRCLLSQCLEL